MTTSRPGHSTGSRDYSSAAVGFTVFAAVLMIIGGIMQAMQGLVALVNDEFYVVGEDYLFQFDVTSWGWIHLLIGIVVGLAGFALLSGATWARAVAVVIASLGIVANFLWLPYYPLWSLVLIALDVFVIWAVTVHGQDIRET
jgi:hypothetical protein